MKGVVPAQVFVPSVGARLARALELLAAVNFIVAATAEATDSSHPQGFENSQELARSIRHLTLDVHEQITYVSLVERIDVLPAPDDDDRDAILRGAAVTLSRGVK